MYLLKTIQAAVVYYNIKSINSLMWGKECNMQKNIRQVGKTVTKFGSENAS